MVAYGYLAYLIRVAPPRRLRRLQRLTDIGPEGRDLVKEIADQLSRLGQGFYRNDGMAEGFRFNDNETRGRSVKIKLRRGPVGNPGETYDVANERATETSEDTALLSELRAAFYIPRDSYFGFLFVERIGGRHVKDLIYQRVLVPVATSLHQTIRVENYAEVEDWRRVLGTQQVMRVTELLRHDSATDASTVEDELLIRVSAEGARVAVRSDELKDQFLDIVDRRHESYRVLADLVPLEERRQIWGTIKKRDGTQVLGWKNAPKRAFTVSDKTEYDALLARLKALESGADNAALREELQAVLPVERDEYESQRIEVTFGETRPEKTFVVTGDRVPQLVYEFSGRLQDVQLQSAWDAASQAFLSHLGVSVGAGWPIEAA